MVKRLFLALLVLLCLASTLPFVSPPKVEAVSTTVTLQPSTTYAAYYGAYTSSESPPQNPSIATTGFSTSMYNSAQSDDGDYAHMVGNGGGDYGIAERFTFNLVPYNTGGYVVVNVTYRWDGWCGAASSPSTVSIMHADYNGGWIIDFSGNQSDGVGWEAVYTDTHPANSTTYQFGVWLHGGSDDPSDEDIYSDCVQLEVIYRTGVKIATENQYEYLFSLSTDYQSAVDGVDTLLRGTSYTYVGQRNDSGTYYVWRSYFGFDTSSVPSNAVNVTATLFVKTLSDHSATDFDIKVYNASWGTVEPTQNTGNWTAAQTYLGVLFNTASYVGNYWYNMSGMSYVNIGGHTQFTMNSSSEGTAPSLGSSYIEFQRYSTAYKAHLIVWYDLPPLPPSVGEFKAPSTVYANKLFYLNSTVFSPDVSFINASIQINGTITLLWVNSTNTFSEYADSNNYCTFDSGLLESVNSTAYHLCWKIMLNWTYPEGSINIVSAQVFDSSSSGTNTKSGLFAFTNDLAATASVDDSRVNPSQSLTFTGQLLYNGTSTPPEDTANISARVELAGVLKGSTTTVNSTGHFTVSFNAEATVGNYTYNVYSMTSETSVANQSVTVKVDRFKVVSIVCDAMLNRTNINNNVVVNVTIQYENDQATVITGTFTLNGSALTYASGVWQVTYSSASVVSNLYNTVTGSGDSYGLSTVNINGQSITIKWDKMKVSSYMVSQSHPNVTDNVNIDANLIYELDSVPVTTGTITINGFSASNLGTGAYRITKSSITATSVTYNVIAGSESTYGLTTVNQNGQSATVIWDKLQVTLSANATNPAAGEYVNCNVTATYAFSGLPVSSWSFNIMRNSTHFASGNFTDHSTGGNVYLYTAENASESAFGLTAFTSNTVTVVWGTLFIEIDQITTVNPRIGVGVASSSYYHCRFSSNLSDCESGTLYVNSTGFSVNSTGWTNVTFTFGTVGARVLNLTGVDVGGVTLYGQIPANPQIMWDQYEVYYFVVTDSHVNVNDSVEVRLRAWSAYDFLSLGSGDSLSVNGSALSWDSGNNWFEKSFSEASVGNWSFQVTSLNEATYSVTNFTVSASNPYVAWDGLEVHDLTLSYMGSGQFRYQAAIRYNYSGNAISGASLKLLYPDGVTETSLTSNSSGWVTFAFSQSNATLTGAWTVYGKNDNIAGITTSLANQTFNLWILTTNTLDWSLDALTGTTLNVYSGPTLVTQSGSVKLPEGTYLVNASWLGLSVNTTASYSLVSSSTLNLQCTAYPFATTGIYHFASDASLVSSFNSTALELHVNFTSAPASYVFVSDAPMPTYVLNCTGYDMAVNYTSYLHLSVLGNETMTVGYANWGGTTVYHVYHSLTCISWSGQVLSLTVSGQNTTGTLEVLCGSRGVPKTTGLSSTLYVASSTIASGTYVPPCVVSFDWTSTGTIGGFPQDTSMTVISGGSLIDLGSIQQGTGRMFNGSFTFSSSSASVSVVAVSFEGNGAEWLRFTGTLPVNVLQGGVLVPVGLEVPSDAVLGSYTATLKCQISLGGNTQIATQQIVFDVVATPVSPVGISEWMTAGLLVGLCAIVGAGLWKRR